MVVRQFVHRASALRPSALIRGAPVRRHLAKLSLERLGSAFAQLWDITSHFHASARLRPRSCPVSSPLEGPCGFGSRLGVRPALRGRGLTSGARFAPLSSTPVQSGLPVGTSSCSTRDGLLSERNQDDRNFLFANWASLWKLLTALLIKSSRTCERRTRDCEAGETTNGARSGDAAAAD